MNYQVKRVAGSPAGFTLVELVTTLVLLGILSTVGMARFIKPSNFEPAIVSSTLIGQMRLARRLATHRADAVVSLTIDRQGANWRMRTSTDLDGVVRTETTSGSHSSLAAASGAASGGIDGATPLILTFSNRGDLAVVTIGATTGDATTGVALTVAGDSNRTVCVYATGYAAERSCV